MNVTANEDAVNVARYWTTGVGTGVGRFASNSFAIYLPALAAKLRAADDARTPLYEIGFEITGEL
jgi:hypothetical protein